MGCCCSAGTRCLPITAAPAEALPGAVLFVIIFPVKVARRKPKIPNELCFKG